MWRSRKPCTPIGETRVTVPARDCAAVERNTRADSANRCSGFDRRVVRGGAFWVQFEFPELRLGRGRGPRRGRFRGHEWFAQHCWQRRTVELSRYTERWRG